MREILFRGREKGGTKWFEGDMSYLVHDKCACYIFPPDGYDSPDRYEVDPYTVGQYTGLTDKNGVKIFEGDIVKYGDTIHLVVFEQRNKTAYFGLVYSTLETLPFGHYQDLRQIEVIGNIYDNQELMEDKQC